MKYSLFFKKKTTIIPDMMVKREMEYDILLFLPNILFLNQFLINTISASTVGFFSSTITRDPLLNLNLFWFGYISLNLTNGHCVLTGSEYPYYQIRGHCLSFLYKIFIS